MRRAHAAELETQKHRLQRLMDRASKLHQYEYEVLPELWDKMTIAVSATASITSRGQSYPAIARMGDGELDEFLKKSELTEWERNVLRHTTYDKRDQELQGMLKWSRLRKALEHHQAFHNYLIARGIFLMLELREKIREFSNLNYDAFSEQQLDLQMEGESWTDRFKKRDLFQTEWTNRLNAIETEIQARIWDTRIES